MGSKPRVPSKFLLHPPIEQIIAGDLGERAFEDFLWVTIEFNNLLSDTQSNAFLEIHRQWKKRVQEESYATDGAEDTVREEVSVRFDAVFAKGVSARFGVAYFVDARESMRWLVDALISFGCVKALTIGEPPEEERNLLAKASQDHLGPPVKLSSDLAVWQDEVLICAPTFSIWLYTDRALGSIPREVLACWDAFKKLVPTSQLRYWATETSRKHKIVGKAALGKLEEWLGPDALPREYISIELHDGDDFNSAPTTEFGVHGKECESDVNANLVHLSFPMSWAFTRAADMCQLVVSLAQVFPFVSGHAGLSLRTSSYFSCDAEHDAWCRSMATPTIDIQSVVDHSFAVGRDGVRTLGWMTLVGNKLLDELGGLSVVSRQLPKEIEVMTLAGGVLFTIGESPKAVAANDDAGLAPYRALHLALHPLSDRCLPRSKWLTTPIPEGINNALWWSRFEPWPELELSREAADISFDDCGPQEVWPYLKSEVVPMITQVSKALSGDPSNPARSERSQLAHEELENALNQLYQSVDRISWELLRAGHGKLALEVMAFAVRLPSVPANLFASLSMREYSAYRFRGAIALCIEAGDVASAVKYAEQALPRAGEEPDIYFCAARAYMLDGQPDKAIESIGHARDAQYQDMRGIKEDASFASLAKNPAFRLACRSSKE